MISYLSHLTPGKEVKHPEKQLILYKHIRNITNNHNNLLHYLSASTKLAFNRIADCMLDQWLYWYVLHVTSHCAVVQRRGH